MGAQAPVKSSESYRKWKQSEAALRRSLNPYYIGKTAGGFLDERIDIDIEQKRLNLYLIDIKYIQNPAKADDHVMLRNMLCH